MVAVGCETEPVSNNEEFLPSRRGCSTPCDADGPDAVERSSDERVELVAKLGENIDVVGAVRFEARRRRGRSRLRPPAGEQDRRRSCKLEGGTEELARQLALHISFARRCADRATRCPQERSSAEREILSNADERRRRSRRTCAEKIVEGMLKKWFYASAAARSTEQAWIHDRRRRSARCSSEAGLEVVEFAASSVAE